MNSFDFDNIYFNYSALVIIVNKFLSRSRYRPILLLTFVSRLNSFYLIDILILRKQLISNVFKRYRRCLRCHKTKLVQYLTTRSLLKCYFDTTERTEFNHGYSIFVNYRLKKKKTSNTVHLIRNKTRFLKIEFF